MNGQEMHRFQRTPSPEILRRLELSRRKAAGIRVRVMQCPVCGFAVSRIPVTQTDMVFARCRKCKFTGPLDPAYFRRAKQSGSAGKAPGSRTRRYGLRGVQGGPGNVWG